MNKEADVKGLKGQKKKHPTNNKTALLERLFVYIYSVVVCLSLPLIPNHVCR